MKCRMVTQQNVKSRYDKERTVVTTTVCKRKAVRFYRVIATGPTSNRHYQPSVNEVFGLCLECEDHANIHGWKEGWGDGTIRGFHGTNPSLIPATESEAQESRKIEHDDYIKHQFKKLFRLKGNRNVPLERWPELMNDAIQEWVIEAVQGT